MLSRRTMAPVCPIRLPRWPRCPFIRSNTCAKGFWTVPMPCWLKRAQLLGATRLDRRPTKVGLRDREVARGPSLCVGMGAGTLAIAYMVEELSDSTIDERHLDLRRPRKASDEVKKQVMCVLVKGVYTYNRCYGSTTGTHGPRVPSVDTRLFHLRAQEASK